MVTPNYTDRQLALMPPWFGEDPQNLRAVITGSAYCNQKTYDLMVFLRRQMRLATMEGESLDLFARDYFGENLLRHYGEQDDPYRKRISVALLPPAVTRQAMIDVLTELTGRAPVIWVSGVDSGFCNYSYCNHFSVGAYLDGPAQAWIIAYRPISPAQAGIYFVNYTAYCDQFYASAPYSSSITDQDIINVIEATKAEGTVMHITLSD